MRHASPSQAESVVKICIEEMGEVPQYGYTTPAVQVHQQTQYLYGQPKTLDVAAGVQIGDARFVARISRPAPSPAGMPQVVVGVLAILAGMYLLSTTA